MPRTRLRVALALAFALVAFALNHVITRRLILHDGVSVGSVTLLRFVSATAALLLLLASRRGGTVRSLAPTRADVAPAALLAAYALAIAPGYAHVGAGAGTLASNAAVVLVMMGVGALLVRKAPAPREVAGAVLAFAGVALLASGRIARAEPAGVALLAVTGAAWGGYTLAIRGAQDALAATTRAFLLATVATAPLALLEAPDVAELSARVLLLGAVMGVGTSALAYVTWAWLVARVPNTLAAVAQLFIPVIAAAFGVLFLAEPFTWAFAAAALLVLVGLALATSTPRATATVQEPKGAEREVAPR